jgi:hypothetical protein
MKTLKYILILVLSLGAFNSCLVDQSTRYDQNDDGVNLVTFETLTANYSVEANGNEYERFVKVKLVGPTSMFMTSDINVTVSVDPSSTAEEGTHFMLNNPTFTLKKADNYLALLSLTILTEGNTPPMEDSPEFESYVAPIMVFNISATGDPNVLGTGKLGKYTLAYTHPNPYAGDYDAELYYFHPTAGGTYPNYPYGGIRYSEKTLVALTARKCQTGFAIWGNNLCWITVKADNSIEFQVADTWAYDVLPGDPNNASNISYFDPVTRQIHLYYHYFGPGGPEIFWETLTPKL